MRKGPPAFQTRTQQETAEEKGNCWGLVVAGQGGPLGIYSSAEGILVTLGMSLSTGYSGLSRLPFPGLPLSPPHL